MPVVLKRLALVGSMFLDMPADQPPRPGHNEFGFSSPNIVVQRIIGHFEQFSTSYSGWCPSSMKSITKNVEKNLGSYMKILE